VSDDWRDDPDWHLAAVYPGAPDDLTSRPPAEAELAQPDGWASLYAGRRILATWSRVRDVGSAPSSPAATIAVP
jgi:hypothetical protein